MNRLKKAIDLDVEQRVVAAAQAYEETIMDATASAEAFLGLAFLYWNCTDIGFSGAHHLRADFVRRAGIRYQEILTAAKTRFGELLELRFWEKYFAFAGIGDPPFVDDCIEWLKSPDAPGIIYLHLYDQTASPQYVPFVQKIIAEAQRVPTAKNRYIVSLLEGDLSKFGHAIS
jgi:hypothetical protein